MPDEPPPETDPPKLVMTLAEAIALAEQLEAAQANAEKS